MAIDDPTDIPEPPKVAEAGVTTSEWRALVIFARQLAGAGTATLVAYVSLKLGVHLNVPPEVLSAFVTLEIGAAVAVAGYAISRGIRKFGTAA
jgi:hypothetical protein